jgi:hypothetical protein
VGVEDLLLVSRQVTPLALGDVDDGLERLARAAAGESNGDELPPPRFPPAAI